MTSAYLSLPKNAPPLHPCQTLSETERPPRPSYYILYDDVRKRLPPPPPSYFVKFENDDKKNSYFDFKLTTLLTNTENVKRMIPMLLTSLYFIYLK